jgi:hypothetical protein
MTGLTLDAGALIAFERGERRLVQLIEEALDNELSLVIPAGVVGQVWRDGRRQALLARLLATPEVEVEVLDDERARAAGQLCGATATADVIDASVVLCAREREHTIVTSDPEDLERLDPNIGLIVV